MSSHQHSGGPPTETASTSSSLYRAVSGAVGGLQRDLLHGGYEGERRARSALSRLRRSVHTAPGQDPETWFWIAEEVLGSLPEPELGRGDEPSYGEWAAHLALTLYAVHQQSQRTEMHIPSVDLGRAVGQLRLATESRSIKHRLDALLTVSTQSGIEYHLRSLITLLATHRIPLDYGRLAQDLKALRFAGGRQRVALRWGRGYATALRPRTRSASTSPDASPQITH